MTKGFSKNFSVDDLLGAATKRAENKRKAEVMSDSGLTPLEVSRKIVSGEVPGKKAKDVPVRKVEPMKEVTRGWLEEAGWDEVEAQHAEHEGDESLIDFLGKSAGFSPAKDALRQVLSLKEGTSTRIKAKEAQLIEDFIKWRAANLREVAKLKAEALKKARYETIEVPGEYGSLFTDRTTLKRMVTSVVRGRDFMLTGEPGVAKGVYLDMLLPTPNGFVMAEHINEGDYLMDEQGEPVKVIKRSPVHHRKNYRVTFEDGASICVDDQHNWGVEERSPGSHSWRYTVLTTEKLASRPLTRNGKRRYRIPLTKPVNYPERELAIHPYVLGVWLGDGNRRDGRITTADREIAERIIELGHATNETPNPGASFELRIYGLKKTLAEMGVLGPMKNTIPEHYMTASVEQRLELLRGLMDSDGTIRKEGGLCSFVNTNLALVEQVVELVRSLGCKCRLTHGVGKLYGKEHKPYGKAHFTPLGFNPFYLPRKAGLVNQSNRAGSDKRYIYSIEEVESKPTVCFAVESASHLFLAGREYIVTHNTEFALSVGGLSGRKTFLMEMSGLSDPGQLIAQQHLEERNGATVTVSKNTPLIEALEAAEAGEQVVLVLDEFPRVTDPLIHNPLLLLLSHRTFSDNINGKQYRVSRENFVVIATANFDAGRNFSGNNRRGVDDASLDRFRVIRVNRPPASVIGEIVAGRVDLSELGQTAQKNVLKAAEVLYSLADKPEIKRLITVRSVISVIDAWVSLDPNLYSLSEVVSLELADRPGTDFGVLDGITSSLELKGI